MQSTARIPSAPSAVADVAAYLDNVLAQFTNHVRSTDSDNGIVTARLHWRDALVLTSVLESYLKGEHR